MSYYGFTVTDKGRALIAKLVAGQQLKLSRVKVGSGICPDEKQPREMEELAHPEADATSTTPIYSEAKVSFTIEYRSNLNGGLDHGFWLREFGVYATDPDDGEVLIYYGALGDYPQWVGAASASSVDVRRFPVCIIIGDGLGVTTEYNCDAWITAEDMADAIAEHNTNASAHSAEIKKEIQRHNDDPEAHASHTGKNVTDPEGVHGLRYTDGQLEVKDEDTWTPLASKYKVMTVIIDTMDSNPNTCCHYENDAELMEARSDEWDKFFGIYPCLLKDGKEVGRLNPNDFTKFEDGREADITSGAAGDVMICFPRRGLRISNINHKITISMTDNPDDPTFKYYAHTYGTTALDAFYVGAYKASYADDSQTKLRSLSGKTVASNMEFSTARSHAQANGEGYQQTSWYPLIFRQACYVLKYRTLKSHDIVGYGYDPWTVGNKRPPFLNTGGTEQKGMTWGEYGVWTNHVKVFGIEDFFGNVWEHVDGIAGDGNTDIVINTGNFQNDGKGAGYVTYKGVLPDHEQHFCIKSVWGTTELGFLPKYEEGGSLTTYFCDSTIIGAPGVNMRQKSVFGGDCWRDPQCNGVFEYHLNSNPRSVIDGARIAYLKKREGA